MLKTFLIIIIKEAANKRDIIGEKDGAIKSGNKDFLKSVISATPFINKFDTTPRVHPTLNPIKRRASKSITKFLIFIKIKISPNLYTNTL